MPTIVYNTPTLLAWQTELPTLAAQIQQQGQILSEQNIHLIPLQSELQSVQSQISSIRFEIQGAEIRAVQDRHYHHMDYHHGHHHHQGPGFFHMVGDVLASANLSALNSQLRTLRGQASQIKDRMQPYQRQAAISNEAIRNSQSRTSWLTAHIAEGNQFLQNIRTNPRGLINPLLSKLAVRFKSYDDDNTAGLSPQVRICLLNLADKLRHLSPIDGDDSRTLQLKYLKLCAFLYDMRRQVALENLDQRFLKILDELIDDTHIAEDGDLPDDLKTALNFTFHFANLQQENSSGVFGVTEETLSALEQTIFSEKLAKLKERSVRMDALQSRINIAKQAIEKDVQNKIKKTKYIDYHFYNRALSDLYDIATNPGDLSAAHHLGQLAESTSGIPSTNKKVLGALLAVLGVLVIAASIALFAVTAGGSSLVSAMGLALGLSLGAAGVTLGGGLTYFGCQMFTSGQRQGLSKDLCDVKEEVLHPTPP